MPSILSPIRNWAERARKAKYHPGNLARDCSVSLRVLERFFRANTGLNPHEWLNELRQWDALVLLRSGKSVKEVAAELGYTQAANFSRDFKLVHGQPPSSQAAIGLKDRQQPAAWLALPAPQNLRSSTSSVEQR